jgi:type III secretory pathway component EscV
MTTLDLKLTLPERLAKQAKATGLLTQQAIEELLRDAMRRRAAGAFLSNARQVAKAKIPPMSEVDLQNEIDAVRKTKRPAHARSR